MRNKTILTLCALGAFIIPATTMAAPAAVVQFAVGEVSAQDRAGTSRPLVKGAPIEAGDTVNTGSGRAQLRFTDGAYVSLQPDSQFRVDEYTFNGKTDGSERGFFSLVKGGLRTITGLVGRTNKRNYQIRTRVATIGIRGTEYTISYSASVLGSVGEGEIAVCNGAGCLDVASGQSYYVADENSLPVLTAVRTSLPPPPPNRHPRNPFVASNDNEDAASRNATSGESVDAQGAPTAIIPVSPPPMTGTNNDDAFKPPQNGGNNTPPVLQAVVLATTFNDYEFSAGGTSSDHTPEVHLVDAIVPGGRLELWEDGSGTTGKGSTRLVDHGNRGQVAWGRFVDGTLDGTGANAGAVFEGSRSFHYVVGKVTETARLPTVGVATYTPVGWTTPTSDSGAATLLGASLVADFAASNVKANVALLGPNLGVVSMTGTVSPVASTFSGAATATGTGCTARCTGEFAGFFAGPNAQYAGMTYVVGGTTFGNVRGAVALRR
jgi:hypothetical protein